MWNVRQSCADPNQKPSRLHWFHFKTVTSSDFWLSMGFKMGCIICSSTLHSWTLRCSAGRMGVTLRTVKMCIIWIGKCLMSLQLSIWTNKLVSWRKVETIYFTESHDCGQIKGLSAKILVRFWIQNLLNSDQFFFWNSLQKCLSSIELY